MRWHPLIYVSILLFIGGTTAGAWSLTSSDLLISQTSVQAYLSTVRSQVSELSATAFRKQVTPSLSDLENNTTSEKIAHALQARVLASFNQTIHQTFPSNTQIISPSGTEACITDGSAVVSDGSWIDLTTGQLLTKGNALSLFHLYLAGDENSSLKLNTSSLFKIHGAYQTEQTTNAQYTGYADALKELGLLQGTSKGYESNRPATRTEGVVMLIRLMGKEPEAKTFKGGHPFTDVPDWADPYIAFAYQKGYTRGMSATTFGSAMQLRYLDYMTFLLRALGYSDQNGDFTWQTSDQMAVDVGIQTDAERQTILKSGKFLRDHVAYTSYRTLFVPTKKGPRLCDILIDADIFSKAQLTAVERKGL